jgi:hypothetical protein
VSRESVEVFGGGEVLVSGPAVLWFATLAERAVHAQRLNGARNPVAEVWNGLMAEAATRTRTADNGISALPMSVDASSSVPVDPVSAQEAAVMMNRKDRNVRGLCARGSFESATRVAGRWQIERAEVALRVAQAVSR